MPLLFAQYAPPPAPPGPPPYYQPAPPYPPAPPYAPVAPYPPPQGYPVAPPPSPPPPMPVAHESPPPEESPGVGVTVDLRASYLRKPPSMRLYTPAGASMDQFGANPVSASDPMAQFGADVLVYARTGFPIWFPLLGVGLGTSLSNSYPGQVDLGGLTWDRRGNSLFSEWVDLPGIGLRFSGDSWLIAASVHSGATYVRINGTITQNELTVDAQANQWTFMLRADLQVCAGEAKRWLCIFAGPDLYEFSAMSGGWAGLRVDAL